MEPTPYDELIGNGDAKAIQDRYEIHRTQRNADQRRKLLSGEVKRLDIDHTLYRLLHVDKYPGFKDERHCLVFWARPPPHIRSLISQVQSKLIAAAPNLWLLPSKNLHLTAMEVTHSLTAPEIAERVSVLEPKLEVITDHTYGHRARLIKPMIGFDASALALSFVPAAGEPPVSHGDDAFTYHHLRRDIWRLCRSTGVEVASRYVVPSAHLTIARFVTHADHSSSPDFEDEPEGDGKLDLEKMQAWLDKIDDINDWLRENYWPKQDGQVPAGGHWSVGEGKGLDCEAGPIWYGSDSEHSVRVGRGF